MQVRSRDPERTTWLTLWSACPKNTNECSHCERRQQTPHEFVLRRPRPASAVSEVRPNDSVIDRNLGIIHFPSGDGLRCPSPDGKYRDDSRRLTDHLTTRSVTSLGSTPTGRTSLSALPELGQAPCRHVDGHDDNGVSHEPTDSPDDDDRLANPEAQIWWSWRPLA